MISAHNSNVFSIGFDWDAATSQRLTDELGRKDLNNDAEKLEFAQLYLGHLIEMIKRRPSLPDLSPYESASEEKATLLGIASALRGHCEASPGVVADRSQYEQLSTSVVLDKRNSVYGKLYEILREKGHVPSSTSSNWGELVFRGGIRVEGVSAAWMDLYRVQAMAAVLAEWA